MSRDRFTEEAEGKDEISPFDTSVARQARIYDYLLGGKDNFAADREAAVQAIAVFPGLAAWARNNRAFLARAVRYLVSEAGVRQFLDIGTGLPTAENTHQVAQRIAPGSRVVYVDNDPVVLVHAQALLTSSPEGATAYIKADLRDPETILTAAAATLDFTRPVALMLLAILHVIPSADDPWEIVARIMAALPSGSYLAISHPASDVHSAQIAEMTRRFNQRLGNVVSAGRTPRRSPGSSQAWISWSPGSCQLRNGSPRPAVTRARTRPTPRWDASRDVPCWWRRPCGRRDVADRDQHVRLQPGIAGGHADPQVGLPGVRDLCGHEPRHSPGGGARTA